MAIADGVALSLLLLVLSFLPSPNAAIGYQNDTRSCDAVARDLRRYTSVNIRWLPPRMDSCSLAIRVSSTLSLTVLHLSTNGEDYSFSEQCYQVSSSWSCPEDCVGLFYNVYEYQAPISVRYMSELRDLKNGYLRLFYCSSRYSFSYFSITSSPRGTAPTTEDPVWRILGPVLATVCIMAAVFLVCVCYAQNFYRRDPVCCRNLHIRLRRMFRCETEERPGAARASGENEAETTVVRPTPCRFVPPHIAAAEILSVEDRPPCYDDIHKYHRRESFAQPPPYAAAVASLRSEMDLGSPDGGRAPAGVDNVAFLPEVGLSDVTVEVDLADGVGGETSPPEEVQAPPREGDSHC